MLATLPVSLTKTTGEVALTWKPNCSRCGDLKGNKCKVRKARKAKKAQTALNNAGTGQEAIHTTTNKNRAKREGFLKSSHIWRGAKVGKILKFQHSGF